MAHRVPEGPRGSQRVSEGFRVAHRVPDDPRGSQRGLGISQAARGSERASEGLGGSQRVSESLSTMKNKKGLFQKVFSAPKNLIVLNQEQVPLSHIFRKFF